MLKVDTFIASNVMGWPETGKAKNGCYTFHNHSEEGEGFRVGPKGNAYCWGSWSPTTNPVDAQEVAGHLCNEYPNSALVSVRLGNAVYVRFVYRPDPKSTAMVTVYGYGNTCKALCMVACRVAGKDDLGIANLFEIDPEMNLKILDSTIREISLAR